MAAERETTMTDVDALIEEYRDRCLWFVRADWRPDTAEDRLRLLDAIERHGDLEAFRRARRLRQWLSPTTNEPSAA